MNAERVLTIELTSAQGLHFLGLIATGQAMLAKSMSLPEPTAQGRVTFTFMNADMAEHARRSIGDAAVSNPNLGIRTLATGVEPEASRGVRDAGADARSLLSAIMRANLTPQEWAVVAGGVFERAVFTSTSMQRAVEWETERAQREGGQTT